MHQLLDFNILFDHIPQPVIILDRSDEVVFFNKRAQDLDNFVCGPLKTGALFTDIHSPEQKRTLQSTLFQVKTTKSSLIHEAEYKNENGVSFFFEAIYEPVLNSDNDLDFICVIFREKTSEKYFEKRSTQMLYDLTALIENANAVIFSVDSREYITDWNSESKRITNYGRDEVLAKRISSFIERGLKNEFENYFKKILHHEPVDNFEFPFKTKDNSTLRILINATPRINNSGNVVGVFFVGHDITELSEYRQSLERKVKDRTEKLSQAIEKEKELVNIKNRFVSMASHEFRVPLSTIASSVHFIKKNAGTEEKILDKLITIEKQIGHMRALIDDVLTLGKTEVAKLTVTAEKFDLIAFLKNISEEVAVNAQNSHEMEFKFSQPVIEIESDVKLMRNVFINLLSNAMKFSPGHSKVYLSVSLADDKVAIKVVDRGIGVSEADLQKIFQPFNRGSNTGTIKGTGLGLSIVKKAVEALAGSIDIESKIGEGTTITVTLKQ